MTAMVNDRILHQNPLWRLRHGVRSQLLCTLTCLSPRSSLRFDRQRHVRKLMGRTFLPGRDTLARDSEEKSRNSSQAGE